MNNYFTEWQIDHYTDRLKEARSDEEKAFVREELHRIKSKYYGTSDPIPLVGSTIRDAGPLRKIFHT